MRENPAYSAMFAPADRHCIAAQFFNFGNFGGQQRQQRGGGWFGGDLFTPFQPSQQPRRVYQYQDFSKAPPPEKRDGVPERNVLVLGDGMADWLAYGLEDAYAEQPDMGNRLSPSMFPEPLSEDRVPDEGIEYKTPSGHWFLLMSASAVLNSNSPKPVLIQVAQDRSDDKAFTKNFGKLLAAVLIGGIACSAAIASMPLTVRPK